MDKEDYTDKALFLLADYNNYNIIPKDPTTKLENNLIKTLGELKTED